jgi:hypothetical protein
MYFFTHIGFYSQIHFLHLPAVHLAKHRIIVVNSLIFSVIESFDLIVALLVSEIVNEPSDQVHSRHCHQCQHKSFQYFLELSFEYLFPNYIDIIIKSDK